ncbi:hypothetical protein G5I_09580 [Acromyrmex echinatior]|uniref:Uncharacterized protein n=1 Tax=Acromyrmex echinatior TaxID=103372 RepID=F4WUK8_ACREC|nr:hypothetical protein G5I_09580 [Acromyrmex echinatior]
MGSSPTTGLRRFYWHGRVSGETQMSGSPRNLLCGREAPRELETRHGETVHSCRKVLQALLGFSIALLGAVSLDDRIVVYHIYLCGYGSTFTPSSKLGRLITVDIDHDRDGE